MKPPVLVTGAHRSGTTWVGRMLALSGEFGYIHEPLNPYRRPGWAAERIPHWYIYIPPGYTGPYEAVLADVLRFRYPLRRNFREIRHPRHVGRAVRDWSNSLMYRAGGVRPLVKDPIALFSAEWMAERFGAQVVVLIRHPAAFAASLKRLGWQFKFKGWLAQDRLLRDWLAPFEGEMRLQSDRDVAIVDQAILMWRAIYHVVDALRKRHPEWLFVRHEDLSREPIAGYERMYGRLALPWEPAVRDRISRFSAEANPSEVARWRHGSIRRNSEGVLGLWSERLTQEEVARIRRGTSDVAPRFYQDEEW